MSQDHLFALRNGTELAGYRIGDVLGSGGYGITYRAEEIALGRAVAIKEYLPNTFARRAPDGVTVRPRDGKQQELFAWGLDRFRQEAETLTRLQHPSIVRVLRYFAANGTAYIVMVYEEGVSLGTRLRGGATLPASELNALVEPLLDGVATVHAARFLHRDIKPDNIYLRKDGSPVLLDFGSARQAIGARTQSITSIVSPGYSPFEQYGKAAGDQGPWTDIYALGATLYRCVTGERPPAALDRIAQRTPLRPAAALAPGGYDAALLAAIDRALAIGIEERPQSIAQWRAMMPGRPAGEAVAAEPGATLMAGSSVRRQGRSPSRRRGADTITPGPSPHGDDRGPSRTAWLAAAGFALVVAVLVALAVLATGTGH
ncbi:MAG: serine/threonine protein kinase [Rhodospirillaceae bacterium]|nr:serine/threonine protein kinase [Rhodospirillaceae bacterium]